MSEHIKISDITPRIHYVADGAQTLFPFPFPIFQASDLVVYVNESAQSEAVTVSGAGLSGGGTALFAVPPSAGARVTLLRRVVLQRVTDFQADGVIRAKTLNDEFDYQTAALQQLGDEVGRAVRRPATSSATADLNLPDPAPGRALKWNESGSALVNSANDPDVAGDSTNAAAAAIAARTAAELARDQAQAAVGGVRVSDSDLAAGQLSAKLAAGPGITLTTETVDGNQQLAISVTEVPQPLLDRLDFLEFNLAINTLRDQIDAGWSLLKMVDGWADEFEDQSGVDPVSTMFWRSDIKAFANQGLPACTYAHPQGSGNRAGLATLTGQGISWGSGGYSNLIDGSTSQNNWHYGDGASGIRLTFDFGGLRYFDEMRFWADWNIDGHTATFKPQASYDGVDFFDIGPVTACPAGQTSGAVTYPIDTQWKAVGFRYVRLQGVAGVLGAGRHSTEVEFKMASDMGGPIDSTLTSAGVLVAQATLDEARLVLLHQPIDSVSLNVDLIAEVSRDGGTTWAAGSLSLEGAFDGTTNILAATVDLSSQPPGTNPRWRVRVLNTKLQRLHGVWMQWR